MTYLKSQEASLLYSVFKKKVMRLAHIQGDRVYNSIRIMKYDASWDGQRSGRGSIYL